MKYSEVHVKCLLENLPLKALDTCQLRASRGNHPFSSYGVHRCLRKRKEGWQAIPHLELSLSLDGMNALDHFKRNV